MVLKEAKPIVGEIIAPPSIGGLENEKIGKPITTSHAQRTISNSNAVVGSKLNGAFGACAKLAKVAVGAVASFGFVFMGLAKIINGPKQKEV